MRVIGDAAVRYNARCRLTHIGNDGKVRIVLRAGFLPLARGFSPDFRVDRRKMHVAVGTRVNVGDFKTVGQRHRLREYPGAADDGDGRDAAAQCVAARRIERPVEIGRDERPGQREIRIAGDHDIGAPIERLADRQIGLASHHHRLAQGEAAEMREVGLHPPRQPAGAPDHAVLGDGGDEDDFEFTQFHRRSAAHTATCGLDVRVRVVALEREILVAEGEDILHRRIDPHRRQRARRARQLQPRLLEMVRGRDARRRRCGRIRPACSPVTCATIMVSSA